MSFHGRVLLEVDTDDRGDFILWGTPYYRGARDSWPLQVGRRTDLGSVPPALSWLLARYGGKTTRPFLLHDELCKAAVVSRRDADNLLRRALLEEGVPELRARLLWAGVRVGSRLSDATGAERLEVLRTVPVAALLLWPALFVWPMQRLLRLLERP